MNPRILALAAGVALGYVLGTRAGREQYDKMKAAATKLWEDPRVAKARRDVEEYARQQAPIIRERAEAAVKAAPGVAKDVAEKVQSTAKDVAGKVSETAKDVAENVQSTAKDVAGKVSETAKDVAERATTAAKDATARVTEAAGDARDKALHELEDDAEAK
ncbi:protoporphyrinogen oxidase [Antiquaquibacter soli]|uniref:Protoporphyrinogen oxidase n=1 Tax=Antiquaquibacter soli TaxID=3064523 RepID=A0ABT9BMG0_9MICO|nr:protoporphyrinogen oxidase [Protaetiibacter sp. WY-16]MDO7881648.1 protoporphyrinogen oxidase [Protaetiibacter sp. WY-16]